ncbi:MAG: ThiF family adenylyltransferase [Acidobacteriota bacterium]
MRIPRRPRAAGGRVVVVGAGGNIGSHLVPHLARSPGIARVILVDRETYEPSNLASQNIAARHVGRPKARVQARVLRAIRPDLETVALVAPVEDLPLGRLRADLILACLDSRRARQHLNQAALHLGVPWVDAGVSGGAGLARISLYAPGPGQPCMQCAWDARDEAILEEAYPCRPQSPAPATGASSALGAAAASLQFMACRTILSGGMQAGGFGRQVVLDTHHHRFVTSRLLRNAACRLEDHRPWRLEPAGGPPGRIRVADIMERGAGGNGAMASCTLKVEGASFVRRLACPACGTARLLLRLSAGPGVRMFRCRQCGRPMAGGGFDHVDRLEWGTLPARTRARTLKSLGIRGGDILTVGRPDTLRHYMVAQEAPE